MIIMNARHSYNARKLAKLTSIISEEVPVGTIRSDFSAITKAERLKLSPVIRDGPKNRIYHNDPVAYLRDDSTIWKAHNQFDRLLTYNCELLQRLGTSITGLSKIQELMEISVSLDRTKRYIANISKDVIEAQTTTGINDSDLFYAYSLFLHTTHSF